MRLYVNELDALYICANVMVIRCRYVQHNAYGHERLNHSHESLNTATEPSKKISSIILVIFPRQKLIISVAKI